MGLNDLNGCLISFFSKKFDKNVDKLLNQKYEIT